MAEVRTLQEHRKAAAVAQQVTADAVLFDYRRSKTLNGMSGTVKWCSSVSI